MPDRPFLIGLVGGIASGKSTVARALERRGARMLDADQIAKGLLGFPEVRHELEAAFGDVESDGRVDHGKLAAVAFATEAGGKRLNEIMHPRVAAAIAHQVEKWKIEGYRGLVVVDAPLLLEAGMRSQVDLVAYVESPASARQPRGRERGWPDGELARREKLQWPLEKKKAAADVVIANAGTLEELETQVENMVKRIARGGR